MTTPRPFQNVPYWLRVVGRVAQCLVLLGFIPLFLLAYRSSAASNILIVFLMIGIVAVVVSRCFAVANGNLIWKFWTASKVSLFGSFVRVLFYVGAALASFYGSVHRAFGLENVVWAVGLPIAACIMIALLSLPPRRYVNWPVTIFSAVMAPVLIGIVLFGVREPSKDVYIVAYPIDAPSLVMHGGPSVLTNYHYIHQSQKHALDIGGEGESGVMMKPGDPLTDDGCFGAPLIAVADGTIVKVVSEEADVEIGERGEGHPAGNHVLLEIAPSRYALYAHLKQSSATVEEGQLVKTGDILGACGNSGNTSQPHLHFQIQSKLDLFDSENQTFPVRFTNAERERFGRHVRTGAFSLRRNDIVRPLDP
ncbi:MAG: M23 family metallopeptidase [Litorimonas sp.]